MRLYVEPMDAVVVEFDARGLVRYEPRGGVTPGADEDWTKPSLQERRAIIYAAGQQIAALTELIDAMDRQDVSTR